MVYCSSLYSLSLFRTRKRSCVLLYIFFFDFKFNTMSNTMSDKNSVNFTRREFLGTVAAAAAFTIVPRSVLGGPG